MLAAMPGCFNPALEIEVRMPDGNKEAMHLEKRLESTPSLDLLRLINSPVPA
jgi:hypothetical protein